MKDKLLLSTPASSFVCKGRYIDGVWPIHLAFSLTPNISVYVLQNRSAKKSCPSVTRATPTRVRMKDSANLCRNDSTSAGAIRAITANIAKTWLTRVTVTRAGTRELANCSKKEDSGKYNRTRKTSNRDFCKKFKKMLRFKSDAKLKEDCSHVLTRSFFDDFNLK